MDRPAGAPAAPHPGAGAAGRLERLRAPLLTAGVVGGLTIALHVRDPHSPGSWGLCPWLVLTGSYCPGCGGLRAVNDLGHGDLVGAASSNLLFVASIPLLVWFWVRWTRRAWAGAEHPAEGPAWAREHSTVLIGAFTVLMLVFAVLRNLPGSWLAP